MAKRNTRKNGEENPMLGFRGTARYLSENFQDCFAVECHALKFVREQMGFKNIESLRQGKTFEINVKEKDEKVALSKAKDMCEKLLANLTIEDYSVKAIKE
jgi:phosphoribosylformylglycinamidine synthase PurS subunit